MFFPPLATNRCGPTCRSGYVRAIQDEAVVVRHGVDLINQADALEPDPPGVERYRRTGHGETVTCHPRPPPRAPGRHMA